MFIVTVCNFKAKLQSLQNIQFVPVRKRYNTRK